MKCTLCSPQTKFKAQKRIEGIVWAGPITTSKLLDSLFSPPPPPAPNFQIKGNSVLKVCRVCMPYGYWEEHYTYIRMYVYLKWWYLHLHIHMLGMCMTGTKQSVSLCFTTKKNIARKSRGYSQCNVIIICTHASYVCNYKASDQNHGVLLTEQRVLLGVKCA